MLELFILFVNFNKNAQFCSHTCLFVCLSVYVICMKSCSFHIAFFLSYHTIIYV